MLKPNGALNTSYQSNLASLSRTTSVISNSSSEETSSLQPPRPRPLRTFTSPRNASPHPTSPKDSHSATYMAQELGLANSTSPVRSKARSRSRNPGVGIDDFRISKTLGDGSYSTVLRATYIPNGREFAIKIMDKAYLAKKNKTRVAFTEKSALVRLSSGHPGVVRLHYTFQDEYSLYFVIDLATNGEMQTLLSRIGSLNVACARYYTAQIVDAIDFIHQKGVIHRDLKPENVLLDEHYRIKIADFGTAKLADGDLESEKFVGTAQYVTPELLEANETSKSSDLWAIGCILYQIIAGRFTFHGLSEFLIFQKVKQVDYTFPEGFDIDAKDLVEKLLVRDPAQRYGAGPPGSVNDMNALRNHPFFAEMKWDTLWTDPAPPLQSGLVKKEHPLANQTWEDVGSEWDNLVMNEDGEDEDEIEWAADARGPAVLIKRNLSQSKPVEFAPGTVRSAAPPVDVNVPGQPNDISVSAASPSSSSDGSTLSKITHVAQANSTRDRLSPTSSDDERGRNKVRTPVQGFQVSIDSTNILNLMDGESVLFMSAVESRSLRRRASKLFSLSVPPIKSKRRELILTNRRLFSLKHSAKPPHDLVIKQEFLLRPVSEKDGKSSVMTVEHKGDREFVVLTPGKTYSYGTVDNSLATSWVRQIESAISSYNGT